MTQTIFHQNHHIKVFIEGTGEPLLFLHGWPTNSRLWKAQADFFKSSYKVITFDWLGLGKSDKPVSHHYTFNSKKETLNSVVNQLLAEHEKVIIVAHDIGGPPAILWAHEHQEKVKKLILLNTLIYPFKTTLDKIGHSIFRLPIVGKFQLSNFGLSRLMQNLIKNKGSESNNRIKEILAWHENFHSQLRRKTILEPTESSGQIKLNQLAGYFISLKIAKYLVIARKDPLCYQHMRILQEEIPEVPVFNLDRCGHFIPIDQPQLLNEILQEILSNEPTEVVSG